ncbi:MAG: RNA methyltransferase [Thermoguttaceae bacterium]
MPLITSLQNPRVKDAIRLRNARHRQLKRRIIIDGVRELSRAVRTDIRMIEIFICKPLLVSEESRSLAKTLETRGGEILQVSEPVFQKLAFGSRAEGLLGVAEMPKNTLADLEVLIGLAAKGPHPSPLPAGEGTNKNPLIAVLEGVEKPGNIGAVLRSADAAGVSALILADACTDLYNPNAIRASLGTIFTVPVCQATGDETLVWLRAKNISIVAARVDGSSPYTEIDYRGPTVLGAADSLNVSATAAVIFYEALRQRNN